jgi:hypothetical protein
MVQPNLIHPIPVTFQLLDRANTVYDKYAREPVGQAIRQGESPRTGEEVTIKGQFSYYFASAKQDYPNFQRAGVTEETTAYVALRYVDMVRAGLLTLTADGDFDTFLLKRGDRCVKVGRETVNYYVEGFKPFAHYPGEKQTMIQVNLMDRHPTHQQGDL